MIPIRLHPLRIATSCAEAAHGLAPSSLEGADGQACGRLGWRIWSGSRRSLILSSRRRPARGAGRPRGVETPRPPAAMAPAPLTALRLPKNQQGQWSATQAGEQDSRQEKRNYPVAAPVLGWFSRETSSRKRASDRILPQRGSRRSQTNQCDLSSKARSSQEKAASVSSSPA